jgi:uncharacterized protein (DUF697 family)
MCLADVGMQPSQPRQSFSLAAALTGTAVGTITLLGWIFGNDALKGLGGTITMKANTAIGLIACGLSLASIVRRPRYWSIVAGVLAGAAGATVAAGAQVAAVRRTRVGRLSRR